MKLLFEGNEGVGGGGWSARLHLKIYCSATDAGMARWVAGTSPGRITEFSGERGLHGEIITPEI